MSDQPLPIAESVWEQAFNESRGYGMYMTAILQVPSHIPSNIVSNCSNFIVHRLGNQKDTELMTTVLVRDSMRDHRDVPRFLVRLPVGMAVVKQARVRNLWEMESCAIMVDYLTTDTPSDEVLLELLSEGRQSSIEAAVVDVLCQETGEARLAETSLFRVSRRFDFVRSFCYLLRTIRS